MATRASARVRRSGRRVRANRRGRVAGRASDAFAANWSPPPSARAGAPGREGVPRSGSWKTRRGLFPFPRRFAKAFFRVPIPTRSWTLPRADGPPGRPRIRESPRHFTPGLGDGRRAPPRRFPRRRRRGGFRRRRENRSWHTACGTVSTRAPPRAISAFGGLGVLRAGSLLATSPSPGRLTPSQDRPVSRKQAKRRKRRDRRFPRRRCRLAFERVWRDSGWRARGKPRGTLSFWRPVPSEGYVACGHVASDTHAPPPIDVVACLRADLARRAALGDGLCLALEVARRSPVVAGKRSGGALSRRSGPRTGPGSSSAASRCASGARARRCGRRFAEDDDAAGDEETASRSARSTPSRATRLEGRRPLPSARARARCPRSGAVLAGLPRDGRAAARRATSVSRCDERGERIEKSTNRTRATDHPGYGVRADAVPIARVGVRRVFGPRAPRVAARRRRARPRRRRARDLERRVARLVEHGAVESGGFVRGRPWFTAGRRPDVFSVPRRTRFRIVRRVSLAGDSAS